MLTGAQALKPRPLYRQGLLGALCACSAVSFPASLPRSSPWRVGWNGNRGEGREASFRRLRGGEGRGRGALAEAWAKREQLGVYSPYYQAAMMRAQHRGAAEAGQALNKVQQMLFDCHMTFGPASVPGAEPLKAQDLDQLRKSVTALTAADLGALETDVDRDAIQYTDVYVGDDFTVCMFKLPAGSRLPMHDHPSMHVLSKVLFGRLEVTAFDRVGGAAEPASSGMPRAGLVLKPFEVRVERDSEVWTAEAEAQITGPECGNIHQFVALSDTCVLDVLAPPYDFGEGRRCTYYEVGRKDGKLYAQPTQCPPDYVTRSVEYKGLPIDTDE